MTSRETPPSIMAADNVCNVDTYKSLSPSSSVEAAFSIRIVDIDSYQSPPLAGLDVCYSDFSGEPIKSVPVIRVFGSTPAGQKTCLHVHGAFPYLSVPSLEEKPSERYLKLFAESINHALQVSLGAASKKESHVFKISVVRGKPFYGYHASECVYLKIYLYNPRHIKRLADLLIVGAIMRIPLQPHESHIPFILQFMIDHNLYGMNYLHSSKVMFRVGGDGEEEEDNETTSSHSPISFSDSNQVISPSKRVWQLEKLASDMLLYESKVSTCKLEGDVVVMDVLNREELKQKSGGGFPGLLSLWDEERMRRERNSIADHLSPPPSPDRSCNLVHSAEERHKLLLLEIIESKTNKATPPSPPFLSSLSQLCEPEFHFSQRDVSPSLLSPDRSETPPIDTPTEDHPVMVDEDVIQSSLRLKKKLSSLSISSSEADIAEVLLDLLNASSSPSPLPLTQTQTITDSTTNDNEPIIDLSPIISTTGSLPVNSKDRGEDGDSTLMADQDNSIVSMEEEGERRRRRGTSSESDIPCNQLALRQGSQESQPHSKNLLDLSLCLEELRGISPPTQASKETTPTGSSSQLSYQERRQLVQLFLEEEEKEEGEGEEEEEEEEQEMTQIVTSDNEDVHDMPRPKVEFIPQLDGANGRRSLKLSRKKSKQTKEVNKQTKTTTTTSSTSVHKEDKLNITSVEPSSLPLSSHPVSPTSTTLTTASLSTNPLVLPQDSKSVSETSQSQPVSSHYVCKSLSLRKRRSFLPFYGPEKLSSSKSRDATPLAVSREATPILDSPLLAERARNNSLVPKIRRLSREDSEKYLPALREREALVPVKDIMGGDTSKSEGVADSKSSRCDLKRKVEANRTSRKRLRLHSKEEEMFSLAVAKSLKTFKEEEERRKRIEDKELKEREEMDNEVEQDETLSKNKEATATDIESSSLTHVPTSLEPLPLSLSPALPPSPHTPLSLSLVSPVTSPSPGSPSPLGSPLPHDSSTDTDCLDFTLAVSSSDEEEEREGERIEIDIEDTERMREDERSYNEEKTNGSKEEEKIDQEGEGEEGVAVHYPAGPSPSITPVVTDGIVITPMESAPSLSLVVQDGDIPSVRYTKAHCSNPNDVQQPQDFGGHKISVPSLMSYELKEFNTDSLIKGRYDPPAASGSWCNLNHWRTVLALSNERGAGTQLPPSCNPNQPGEFYTSQKHQDDVRAQSQYWPKGPCIITPLKTPPSFFTATKDMVSRDAKLRTPSTDEYSIIEGPSLDNTYGFELTPTTDQETESEVQFVTLMSIELHIRTRDNLNPDPEWDPVLAIFYYIHNDWPRPHLSPTPGGCGLENATKGIIAIDLSQPSSQVTTPTKRGGAGGGKGKGSFKTLSSPRKKFSSPSKILLGNQSKISAQEMLDTTDMDTRPYLDNTGLSSNTIHITYVSNEKDLFDELVKLVRRVDPDVLLGYEIQKSSWGYLKSRGSHLGINLIGQISRVPTATTPERSSSDKSGSPSKKGAAWFEERHNSDIHVIGRILLNVWRTMKEELSLTSYSFENVTYHALYQRLPKFSYQTLTEWYDYRNRLYRSRVVDYYMVRCHGNCLLLEKFNLIGRTSELARLYGIEFHNVLARGSQYRVESMMLRLAKQYNYIAASPSIQQRARMAAPECLPLIMEPESKFYTDPVLVLDFQSLYPSMVIAHNYCYSTCLGRVKHLTSNNDGYKFGTCSLSLPDDILLQLQDSVSISPNGVVFVKSDVRRGVMPQMLEEILNTRIMIKQSMKLYKDNKVLQRILDARQLGLKLIANVTYGYTAANYSGRMPCVEIADSIVRKGRETLERAIQLVESTPKWRAKVVYGDTDSMFVLLKGVSKEEAFRIGREISKAVTADNPKPVKLKFEKVYISCTLQTKKRYAGYMYETLEQSEPVFEAKGIETVRRDNCPAVSKILEKSLKLLFSTKDVSLVKSYVQSQCTKILNGRVSTSDFVFAKEYRGRSGYRPGACVAALELAKQRTLLDRQAEPLVGERVPYVIVYGPPGLPLIQLVRSLEEFTSASSSLRLNSNYYITKQILPALSRSFSLLGVDVFQWYHHLPRSQRSLIPPSVVGGAKKSTISQYFASAHCAICGTITSETPPICPECSKNPQSVAVSLSSLVSKTENNFFELCKICQHCCGSIKSGHYLECVSLDCPVFYSRLTSIKRMEGSAAGSQKIFTEFLNKQSNTRNVTIL